MRRNITMPLLTYGDLNSFALHCKNKLLVNKPYEFLCPAEVRKNDDEKIWEKCVPQIKELNNGLLSILRNNANLYAISF
ncbi:hypothetical protein SAMN05660706_11092 [Desulfoscipio geothermicus DSM 3669]|uniref:Uncharacterized protein n=1 Tax=Desulfoscipio geothermicus DSM 3669 TaxID=1121426 RepID=A0A1I6DGM3_9FIRM|nr:hypothetical protein SAMN05660706_11092 [Desulfoscipio geothermicus DSM 3669]